MNKTYEAWAEQGSVTLASVENIADLRARGILGADARFLYRIEAGTFEEAMSVYSLRLGYGPYKPAGKPQLCPKDCGLYFYPEGSGECANCGKIC